MPRPGQSPADVAIAHHRRNQHRSKPAANQDPRAIVEPRHRGKLLLRDNNGRYGIQRCGRADGARPGRRRRRRAPLGEGRAGGQGCPPRFLQLDFRRAMDGRHATKQPQQPRSRVTASNEGRYKKPNKWRSGRGASRSPAATPSTARRGTRGRARMPAPAPPTPFPAAPWTAGMPLSNRTNPGRG